MNGEGLAAFRGWCMLLLTCLLLTCLMNIRLVLVPGGDVLLPALELPHAAERAAEDILESLEHVGCRI